VPDLVEVHDKYRKRGVAFVSVTGDSQECARELVGPGGVSWPCLYGATEEVLIALGVRDRRDGLGLMFPTVYVIGRDGKVAWDDGQSRYRHEDRQVARRNLERALDRALAAK
jgi:peroxiredoxin